MPFGLGFGFWFWLSLSHSGTQKTKPGFRVSLLLSDSPPTVISREDSPTSCYHLDALVAG